jgi:hypothetical protein
MITLVPALLAAADEIRTNSKENVKKPFIIFPPPTSYQRKDARLLTILTYKG